MRGLDIHKNIPVSVTKLTLGLRVSFISSHLTANKFFPVNPRAITGLPKMSLLLEAKSMPALIIKPRLILVAHRDDLGLVHNVQPAEVGRSKPKPRSKPEEDCQQDKCYARADTVLHHRQHSNWLDVSLKLSTNTQVWNRLGHRNDRLQRGVNWVTYRCYNSNPY